MTTTHNEVQYGTIIYADNTTYYADNVDFYCDGSIVVREISYT